VKVCDNNTMPGLTREERRFRDDNPVKVRKGEKKLVMNRRRTWDEIYEALTAYKKQHGDCEVPQRYNEDPRLGGWVGNQRKEREKLSSGQRKRLDDLGFDWRTRQEREEFYWNEKFKRLEEYRQIYGDCKVPQSSVDEELTSWVEELGSWVCTQRSKCKKGKLSSDRTSKLESLQFEWVLKEPSKNIDRTYADEKWHFQYLKLVDFHTEHGHCIVPSFYDIDKSLGMWVGKQRQIYAANRMPEDRKLLLDELGFVWKVDKADADASLSQVEWDEQLGRIIRFKEQYGHSNVPRNFTKWGLGSWLCVQRAEARKGQLDTRRVHKLLSVGVTWGNNFDQRWEERFLLLKAFQEKHGHCHVLLSESIELKKWVINQQKFQKNGTLLPARKAKLDAVGLAWAGEKRRAEHSRHDSCDLEDSEDEETLCEPGALIPSRKRLRRLGRSNDR
jgi:hypothetical protein